MKVIKDYNRLLDGKKVFISSGQRGIGKDIAILFARHGAVIALGGRNEQTLDQAVRQLLQYSPRSRGYVCDLSVGADTEKACDMALQDFGCIDILINTVGVNSIGLFHEQTEDAIERLIETNYKSGIRCAKKFIPHMIEQKYGNIINISSIHSTLTMPGFSIYAGTKGAVNATARAMALDYAGKGIRVNTICPGLIMSDTVVDEINAYQEGEKRDAFVSMLNAMQPLPPGGMDDISHTALYLASDLSGYVTGQTIMVDGGASIKAH